MFADVLDAMGKPPREFAGIHVHFESIQRVDGRRFVVSLLLQSAFEPVPNPKLVLVANSRVLLELTLPSLTDGRVVRMRIPVKVEPGDGEELGVRLEGPSPGGRRVRTAWKLHETVESPRSAALFTSGVREEARQLEPALKGPLLEGSHPPLGETLFELLWRPGQRVPEFIPPVVLVTKREEAVRWCRECGFEGPKSEHVRSRQCPQCGEPWF